MKAGRTLTGIGYWGAVIVILALTPPGHGEPQQTVIRTETRMVEISVIATGRDGKTAAGLTRGDFSISEEGKPQKVAAFSAFAPSDAAVIPAGVQSNHALSGCRFWF